MRLLAKQAQSRRSWLRFAGAGLVLGRQANQSTAQSAEQSDWEMGLIADLHFGLAEDALGRLHLFMEEVLQRGPACILQLGDFNYGKEAEACMSVWGQFAGPKYHVLGNHDMDKANKSEMVEVWEMPGNHYSFDLQGWHFVILDRNHLRTPGGETIDYDNANFYVDAALRGFADPVQLEWLADDLRQTGLPTVIFSHQGLGMGPEPDASSATGMIESVLAKANQESPGKVRACFCGHHHVDRYNYRQGIHYVWINSASYYWVGPDYGRMAAYTKPLFTFLTFRGDGSIQLAGCQSKWASPSPQERGFPGWQEIVPAIRQRHLS